MLTRRGFLAALLGAAATACGCASKPKPKTPCSGYEVIYAGRALGKSLRTSGPVYMVSDLHFGNGSRIAVSAEAYIQAALRHKHALLIHGDIVTPCT